MVWMQTGTLLPTTWLLAVWNRDKYGEVKRVEQKIDTTMNNLHTLSANEINAKVIELLGIDLDE